MMGGLAMHQNEAHRSEALNIVLRKIPDLELVPQAQWASICRAVEDLTEQALHTGDRAARRDFHESLHLLQGVVSAAPHTWGAVHSASARSFYLRQVLFNALMARELSRIADLALPPVPKNPSRLTEYLLDVNADHIASRHPVFDYLREQASLRQVKSFFYQEGSVDARFDDLIALAQIGLDGSVKDEYAHNFEDEMGHGNPDRVHTVLFERTANYVAKFGGEDASVPTVPCTEALACSNLQVGMALDRRHVWRMAGYLAAFELNATDRCRRLTDACVRQGMDEGELTYLTEHIDADVGHAEGLFEEILLPMAASDERASLEIAQGFVLRLQTSQEYCDELLRGFLTTPTL